MNAWTCNTFAGYNPVGTAAVVWADTRESASELLNKALRKQGLPGDTYPSDMMSFPSDEHLPEVRVLCDGDY